MAPRPATLARARPDVENLSAGLALLAKTKGRLTPALRILLVPVSRCMGFMQGVAYDYSSTARSGLAQQFGGPS